MKTLKKLILGVLILIGLALIAAWFTEKNYSVEREIVINKPKQQVFDYVKYLKNQNNYSKWATLDKNMKTSFKGTDGTVGFVSAWDSENSELGTGEQEITKISDGDRIDYELRFIKPFEGISPAYMSTESVSDSVTKIKWGMSGTMAYPTNIAMWFMDMKKMIGDDFDTGLTSLKGILEK
jgi:Polyketide cyclase / dehydrase and lipid transport